MSTADTDDGQEEELEEEAEAEAPTHEYELVDELVMLRAADLTLEGDDTVELTETEAQAINETPRRDVEPVIEGVDGGEA